MRKHVMTLAVVAVGLLVMACGNKSGNNAAGADSTAVAAAPEAKAPSKDLPEVKKIYEKTDFSVGVPEGWETMPNDDPESMDIMLLKGGIDKITKEPFIMIDLEGAEGQGFEADVKDFQENTNAKALDDVTLNGLTYKAFYMEEGEIPGTILVSRHKNLNVSITIGKADLNDPEIQAILQSFKLK